VPFETLSPFITSGIRVGTPAITSRGMGQEESRLIARLVARVLKEGDDCLADVRSQVITLCERFPLYEGDVTE